MSQTQSLRKKNSADKSSTQPLQRNSAKNASETLDKKTDSGAEQDNAPLQKKAYRTAQSSSQSAAQDEPRLQTKLSVSTPGDSHEQEADRVADEVVSRSATEENKLSPGSTKPENNASSPQSLQTKISRMAEPAPAATETSPTETDASAPTETATDNEQGVSAEVEQQIESLKGQGSPLSETVRAEMEAQFSHDFSSVSIHADSTADTLCKQLSARAFTIGSDIFFASGEYAPDSQEGKRLLAHELTHVVQQGSGVTRKIMRDEATTGDVIAPFVTIGTLQLPRFKATRYGTNYQARIDGGTLYRPAGYRSADRTDRPSRDWDRDVSGANITQKIIDKIGPPETGRVAPYIIVPKNSSNPTHIRMGTPESLASRLKRPNWNRGGRGRVFQVDHIIEKQLNGEDTLANYELLESDSNNDSGTLISDGMITTINAFLRRVSSPEVQAIPEDKRDIASLKTSYNIKFNNYRGSLSAGTGENWTSEQIENGDHMNFDSYIKILDPLYPNRGAPFSRWPSGWNPIDYVGGGVNGGPSTLVIYANEYGGKSKRITWPANAEANHQEPFPENQGASTWIKGFRLESVLYNSEASSGIAGKLRGTLFSDNPRLDFNGMRAEIDLCSMPGLPYVAHADKASIEAQIREIFRDPSKGVSGASPIRIDQAGLDDEGILVAGKLLPSIPMIANADIDLILKGNDLRLEKTFNSGEVTVPNPFHISNSSLTLAISTQNGFLVSGTVSFGIDKLGEGHLEGVASTGTGSGGGFTLAGEFNFDDRIFGEGTNAQVRMGYANDQWSMGGTITIPEGKVPGIRTATINVDYSQGAGFSATGTASLNVPGVESGTIEITHNEEEGFVIGGSFNLSQGRGIRGGQISARVQEKPDGTGYAVTAHGEAQPDIPGINSNLIVDYNDGAFTAEVSADYSRGMLSGQIHAGVTNRTVNDDGTLAETASENNELVVFGDGELTIQIAPWLQGTAGVRFAPNGEITVIGRIGLPDELEIFARREINRSIFNIAVQAPIFPGIVAEVGGGLSATAGIGPGVIDQLTLQIEYNPAHEEDTHITGDAHLNIPANAGLRLNVRAGIGLGITGASATGGLDIGGTLGIEGAAEAGVHVDWTPATGLDITAELAVHAQPSFTFDIGGYVSVRALGFEVYDNRWEFASYTFGSDYRFGIRLPIHYHEGEPFDISTDDIEFEVPDIDTNQLLRGLIARIA